MHAPVPFSVIKALCTAAHSKENCTISIPLGLDTAQWIKLKAATFNFPSSSIVHRNMMGGHDRFLKSGRRGCGVEELTLNLMLIWTASSLHRVPFSSVHVDYGLQ